jgi:predicted nucleotidyltransferase component of viral defense system
MKPTKATFDFRKIAQLEAQGKSNLLPVIEKELIHYDILRAMSEGGFLENLCFQGGTALRLCFGSERFSEDLDFTGGIYFDSASMNHLKQCIEDHLSSRYGLLVEVKPPKEKRETGIAVTGWQVKVITAPGRPDIASQKIKIEVANVPSYSRELIQIAENYSFVSSPPLIIGVQSMEEIMADKLLALPASEINIRYRDLWDLHWMLMRRVKPNIELLNQKISDYGVESFTVKLQNRIDSLTAIIDGPEFTNQMLRFLTQETINNTIKNANFRVALKGSLTGLLSMALN